MTNPRVVGVHRSGEHRFGKPGVDGVELHEGLGVAGDAHYGATVQHLSRVRADPSQPNLRQVHLLHAELIDALNSQGFTIQPGELGENITTCGIDLLGLPVGTRLHIGVDAVVAVTGLRNPCHQIDGFQNGLLKELARREGNHVVRLAGVMGVVSRSGSVATEDQITFTLPPKPHLPRTRV